jgi:hypothetical protein
MLAFLLCREDQIAFGHLMCGCSKTNEPNVLRTCGHFCVQSLEIKLSKIAHKKAQAIA